MLADCRTIEACGGHVLGVITANTVQNHSVCTHIRWEMLDDVLVALDHLRNEAVAGIKIGIVPDFSFLTALVQKTRKLWPHAPVVWDPVLRSTSGTSFLDPSHNPKSHLDLTLCTPNTTEFNALFADHSPSFPLLIKSWEESENTITDMLVQAEEKIQQWTHTKAMGQEKRGTGCILSSAIATYLGKGQTLETAITNGNRFLQTYYRSTTTHLGHYFEA